MSEEKDKRRPAHEVVIEAIGANAGAVEKLGSDFLIRAPTCAAEAVMMLCEIVKGTTFPQKHLAEMIGELQRINEQASASGSFNMYIEEAIRDLEGRQVAEQPTEEQPAPAAPGTEVLGPSPEPAPAAEPAPEAPEAGPSSQSEDPPHVPLS